MQPRNAENTKASIIKAARRIFEAKGYEMATLRDIADVAGCNVALIARYFGSKRGLFQRAVLDTVNLRWSLTAPDKSVAEALADYYTTQPRNTQEFDGFVTILRSFASPEVGPLISDTLVAQGRVGADDRHYGRPRCARAGNFADGTAYRADFSLSCAGHKCSDAERSRGCARAFIAVS